MTHTDPDYSCAAPGSSAVSLLT